MGLAAGRMGSIQLRGARNWPNLSFVPFLAGWGLGGGGGVGCQRRLAFFFFLNFLGWRDPPESNFSKVLVSMYPQKGDSQGTAAWFPICGGDTWVVSLAECERRLCQPLGLLEAILSGGGPPINRVARALSWKFIMEEGLLANIHTLSRSQDEIPLGMFPF